MAAMGATSAIAPTPTGATCASVVEECATSTTRRVFMMKMAAVVPTKTTGAYTASRIMAFMKEVGCEFGDLTVKLDQEPAIRKVVADRLRYALRGSGKIIFDNH